MAKSLIQTLMPLDQYAEMLGIDPRHFNQVVTTQFPDRSSKSSIFRQYQWQRPGLASRRDIAQAIATAEQLIAERIRFWPGEKYTVDETISYPFGGRVDMPIGALPLYAYPTSGTYRLPLPLEWLRIISPGRRVATILKEEVPIVYSDPDGDGFNELATISLTVDSTDGWEAKEIAVTPVGANADDINQIRYLTVTLSGTSVIVQGQSAWFVDSDQWNNADFIDGNDASSFLAEVDIYRISTEESSTYKSCEYLWQDYTSVTSYPSQDGVMLSLRPDIGYVLVHPATWDEDTSAYALSRFSTLRKPTLVKVSYLSGWPMSTRGGLTPPFDRAVAALATALLPSRVTTGAESVDGFTQRWQDEIREPTYRQQSCPFGQRYGAWEAWNIINSFYNTPTATYV